MITPRRIMMGLVRGYQLVLSPWLGNQCRFEPSCSAYTMQALERHGAAAGSYLMLSRIARCQPWCQGGCDPVPEVSPRLVPRFLSRLLVSPPAEKKTSS